MLIQPNTSPFAKNAVLLFAGMTLVLFFLAKVTTPYMATATFSYILLCLGVAFRRTPAIHSRLMMTGAAIDVLLVLVLEVQRSAIATSMGGKLNPFQMAHIAFSLLAVLLYGPAIFFGKKFMNEGGKPTHRTLGRAAFLLRTLGFLFMFSMLEVVRRS